MFLFFAIILTTVGVRSEVTLHKEDNIHWFDNFDETEHKLSTEGPKGGVQAQQYHNPSFPWTGDQIIKSNHHIIGVYSTNPLKALPPLYIFDTNARSESNYNIDPAWCHGLPKVHGMYGTGQLRVWDSFVAMWPKGGMDKPLFPLFIKNVILPCNPNLQKETVRCPSKGRKIKGPFILKTDTGPGCLSRDEEHLKFKEELMEMGVHILLDLPDGTESIQEMEDGPRLHKS